MSLAKIRREGSMLQIKQKLSLLKVDSSMPRSNSHSSGTLKLNSSSQICLQMIVYQRMHRFLIQLSSQGIARDQKPLYVPSFWTLHLKSRVALLVLYPDNHLYLHLVNTLHCAMSTCCPKTSVMWHAFPTPQKRLVSSADDMPKSLLLQYYTNVQPSTCVPALRIIYPTPHYFDSIHPTLLRNTSTPNTFLWNMFVTASRQ